MELSDSTQSFLQTELLKIKHRTYLWVKLILEIIYSGLDMTEKRFREIVSTMPDTVDKAYEAILKRTTDIRRARKLLQIVVAAARPFIKPSMIFLHHMSLLKRNLMNFIKKPI